MRTPCEWTLSEFIPRVKSNLAKELKIKHGKNQTEIASLLGVSQARVSQYLKKDNKIERPLNTGPLILMQNQIEDVIERTVSSMLYDLLKDKSPASTIPIICAGCRELRTGNALCTLHMLDYQELGNFIGEKNCDLCLRWKTAPIDSNNIEGRIETLNNLENIVNQLLTKLTFLDFIPQIGAQVCIYNVSSTDEHLRNVASYPGRIIKYQEQARVVSKPQFFTSKTTASFLLALRKIFRSLTTVLSIKNFNIDFLNINDFSIFETNEGDKIGFIEQLKSQITDNSYTRLAILDSGSIGYEPIAYFFVSDPIELLKIFE